MPSTFTWLDYSEQERRKMLDVIDLFGERDTRDELGLAGVRDAFADLLFPGTSTVQTVAKYFLLIPWMYLDFERKKIPSAKIAERGRRFEIELARELEKNGGSEGVIGRIAKEKLRRLPSNVYWQGMARWGIRLFDGSQDQYHKSLDLHYARQKHRSDSSDGFDGESKESVAESWHPGLPKPAVDFPQGMTLKLTSNEAMYLRERILTNCSQSLLAFLVQDRIVVDGVEFAWDLATVFPARLQNEIEHGRNFSEAMHGAQLLYNFMLAERRNWEEMIGVYRDDLDDWWKRVSKRMASLRRWNRIEFWVLVHRCNPRVTSRARAFIQNWIDLVTTSSDIADFMTSDCAAQRLIEGREIQLKGRLARMKGDQALLQWNGAAGALQMNLRWSSAQQMISDIYAGLESINA